jgi:hypothetical protein
MGTARLLNGGAALAFVGTLTLAGCGGDAPGASSTTTTPSGPTASNLTITLDRTTLQNASSTPVTATVTATTASGQTVSGLSVSIEADTTVAVSPGTVTTAASGSGSAAIRTLSKANRAVVITARSGSLSQTASFLVQGAALSATVVTPQPPVGTQVSVNFSLRDSAGNAMTNEKIAFSSSRSSFAPFEALTDAQGNYSLTYTAPSTAGDDVITASAAGARPLLDPVIQVGGSTNPPPSSTPATFSLQVDPATVDSNPTGSTNRATLSVRVFNAQGNPVSNAAVRFRIATGATFGQLAATGGVLSDGTGFARTDFVPGPSGSAQNQILVCAQVENSAAVPSNPSAGCAANESGVELTVRDNPVSIVIAPSGVIIVPNDLVYIQQYVVQVARVGGAPVQGASISVDPIEHELFFKGAWVAPAGSNDREQVLTAICPNEDGNRNDIIDTINGRSEDRNGNGRLDPRRPVNYRFVGDGRTDSFGQAILEVTYPKAFGSWVSMTVSVRVTVGGSESRAVHSFTFLPISSAEADAEGDPAFVRSPFGVAGFILDENSTPEESVAGCFSAD